MIANTHYTQEETEALIRLHNGYYTVREIADKLKKSEGSIIQKARNLGLRRDPRLVKVVRLYGRRVLSLGHDRVSIRAAIEHEREQAKITKIKERSERQQVHVDRLKHDLTFLERDEAMRKAYNKGQGATLAQIGKIVGLTRAGVSWAINPKKRRERHVPWR